MNDPVNVSPQDSADRRAWLRASARWLALGGLGAMTAAFAWRAAGAAACPQAGPCRTCGLVAGCSRPEARPFKDPQPQRGAQHAD